MSLGELLGKNSRSFPWERALLFALAVQVRSALLLLGAWLSQSTQVFPPFLSRLRVMPAHPDWYLASMIQSLAIGLALVWIVRRLAIGWAVPLVTIAGTLAWLTASRYLTSLPVESFALVLRFVLEFIDTLLLLGILAALLALLRSIWGIVLAATTAAALCGVVRLLLTYSVWGTPWIGTWRFDLGIDALSGAALGLTLLLLPVIVGRGSVAPGLSSAGLYLGAHGLSVLALAYLQLAMRFADWQPTDAPPLLWLVGGLTAVGYAALFSVVRKLPSSGQRFRLHITLELCAVPFLVFAFGHWNWALSLIAVIGLIALRALGTLAVIGLSGARPRHRTDVS